MYTVWAGYGDKYTGSGGYNAILLIGNTIQKSCGARKLYDIYYFSIDDFDVLFYIQRSWWSND